MTNRRINPNFNPPIGFETMLSDLNFQVEKAFNNKAAQSYPPYNLIKIGEHTYHLEIAVAGFGQSDLKVTQEKNTLKVVGEASGIDEDNEYLHKGIAARGFTRSFTLADNVEVDKIQLVNGMLTIRMKAKEPEKTEFEFDIEQGPDLSAFRKG